MASSVCLGINFVEYVESVLERCAACIGGHRAWLAQREVALGRLARIETLVCIVDPKEIRAQCDGLVTSWSRMAR